MAITLEKTLTERFSGYLPISYEVSPNANPGVDGGTVVMYDAANPGKVIPCNLANAGLWLGVARYFGAPGSEWEEKGAGRVRGLIVNEPIPRIVACPHFGVYDLVNAGAVPVLPGMGIQVIDNEGRVGRTGDGVTGGANGNDPAYRAVVGTVLGLATGDHKNNTGTATNARPVPPGSKMRVRLGRG